MMRRMSIYVACIALCALLAPVVYCQQDPCFTYTSLNEAWRNVNNNVNDNYCDQPRGKGAQPSYYKWFRITGAAGNTIPDKCPPSYNRCGATVPVWMRGKHPSFSDGVRSVQFCGYYSSSCCRYQMSGKVRRCPGGYYVYYLPDTPNCALAYCGDNVSGDPCLRINCTDGCTVINATAKCSCKQDGAVWDSDKGACVFPCSTAGCSHYCRIKTHTLSAECYCPLFYQLGSNTTCQYIDLCKSSPCDHNARCHSNNGSVTCTCNDGLFGNGFQCREESPVDRTAKRCKCSLNMEIEGTTQGPKLFDLPTMVYGQTKTWIQTRNGTRQIEAVYPDWFSKEVTGRALPELGIEDIKACFNVLRRCPRDCERLAKLLITDGPSTSVKTVGSAGSAYNPLGQVMCHNAKASIPKPGVRPVVFYDGGVCGYGSTHNFPIRLCCSFVQLSGVGNIAFWDSKCSDKFDVSSLFG